MTMIWRKKTKSPAQLVILPITVKFAVTYDDQNSLSKLSFAIFLDTALSMILITQVIYFA